MNGITAGGCLCHAANAVRPALHNAKRAVLFFCLCRNRDYQPWLFVLFSVFAEAGIISHVFSGCFCFCPDRNYRSVTFTIIFMKSNGCSSAK